MSHYKLNESDLKKFKDIIINITKKQEIQIFCDEKTGNLSKSDSLVDPFYIYTIKIDDFETRVKFNNQEDVALKAETVSSEYLIKHIQ